MNDIPSTTIADSPASASRRRFLSLIGLAGATLPVVAACRAAAAPQAANPPAEGTTVTNDAWRLSPTDPSIPVQKSEEEWRRLLTKEQFHVARQKGTERAFTGETWDTKDKGVYRCVACGLEIFSSEAKYDSGTGWPSFSAPIAENRVGTEIDKSLFSVRTEVHCPRCGSHLGHVFPDGPRPTGLRYCMNSAAMKFEKRD